ncbi:MAG: hypothetical protein K6F52_01775, partial [Clostridia bacterium]|nr:hypothetical protein [Clostridia bacterium]
MKFEEKIFERKRFDVERLTKYGFRKTEPGFVYETGFMNDEFRAIITVTDKGTASGKVIDLINDEEYAPLRNENMTGAFVGKVREEYENILSDICDKCC